jgi:lysophospholipase L1-like esterase
MVAVAQLVEPRVVISAVVGSSPIGHPIFRRLVACLALALSGTALAASDPPQLFVAGDSTASSYEANPKSQQGWGAVLQPLFDERKLRVVNVARGGRSSRTFITEGHWDRMLDRVRAGDFVIIQFGHNDAGAINAEPPGSTRPLRARGTLPGIGPESEGIDNVLTSRHETVYTFGGYLRKMIADVRAKSATPILMSLTKTNHFKDGRVECPAAGYRLWDFQVAQAEKVAFVDLTRLIADRYQREGPEVVKTHFIDDTVHTNETGATANARDVVSALRADRTLPFRKMLSKAGRAVPADRGPPATGVCSPLS